ncbi:MAG: MaoC like domain protein [Candidatus Methanolliviera sp. GoM_asphalt]|nr:MAG: MaoC like domain protein [Candidatus Methanolliviera sp. GoM_asphalt]
MVDLNVLGKEFGPFEFKYTWKDVVLYALGLGATNDDLNFVYENDLKVYPTFAVLVPPFSELVPILEEADLNLMMLLHAGEKIVLHKDISTEGTFVSTAKVSNIYDTGKHSVMYLEMETKDENGNLIFNTTFSALVRGDGGFGGEKPPEAGNVPPEGKEPDFRDEIATYKDQNLLYRLSGDLNPLHVDPEFAKMAGYDRCILHGLCTYGIAGRSILRSLCDNDPKRFKSFEVRFSNVVFPGDTIITEGWKVSDEKYIIQTKNQDGKVVLSNAAAEIR